MKFPGSHRDILQNKKGHMAHFDRSAGQPGVDLGNLFAGQVPGSDLNNFRLDWSRALSMLFPNNLSLL